MERPVTDEWLLGGMERMPSSGMYDAAEEVMHAVNAVDDPEALLDHLEAGLSALVQETRKAAQDIFIDNAYVHAWRYVKIVETQCRHRAIAEERTELRAAQEIIDRFSFVLDVLAEQQDKEERAARQALEDCPQGPFSYGQETLHRFEDTSHSSPVQHA